MITSSSLAMKDSNIIALPPKYLPNILLIASIKGYSTNAEIR